MTHRRQFLQSTLGLGLVIGTAPLCRASGLSHGAGAHAFTFSAPELSAIEAVVLPAPAQVLVLGQGEAGRQVAQAIRWLGERRVQVHLLAHLADAANKGAAADSGGAAGARATSHRVLGQLDETRRELRWLGQDGHFASHRFDEIVDVPSSLGAGASRSVTEPQTANSTQRSAEFSAEMTADAEMQMALRMAQQVIQRLSGSA